LLTRICRLLLPLQLLCHCCCCLILQVAKLLVIPFVCGVEAVWFKRRFNTATIMSIMAVMVGVATV
jgi:hypothetical protein